MEASLDGFGENSEGRSKTSGAINEFSRRNRGLEGAYLHAALPLGLEVSQPLPGRLKIGLALGEGGQDGLHLLLHLLSSCLLLPVRPLLP
jgi:hypothetical protein